MISDHSAIKIAVLQSELHWEDTAANLASFSEKINSLKDQPDLVVLPETFSSGFTMNVVKCADRDGSVLAWMKDTAEKRNIFVAGSVIVFENGKYYNRLYFCSPGGKVTKYDKRHLFRIGREQEYFTRGKDRVIAEAKGFRILLQVCYDLRFPVFARNRGDYDVILYVANWPSARKAVWNTLIPARAIENQAYVIGANCTGLDGEGEATCGESKIMDPKGNIMAQLDSRPGTIYAILDLNELQVFRRKFPVAEDADDFQLRI